MNSLIASIVILGVIAIFSAVPSSYRALYLGLGLLLLVQWGLRDNTKKIKVTKDLSGSSGFAGTELFLQIQLFNRSWFPIFWCTVMECFPEQLGARIVQALVSLPPRGQKVIRMTFYPQRRGIYPVPDTKLAFGDPFGLKEVNLNITAPEKIIIYPPLFQVIGLNLNRHLPLGHKTIMFGLHEDPSRLRGCRDYCPGDSVKKIHWPNLARSGILKVKEWESTLSAEIGIFLNLREEDFPVSDWFWLTEHGIDFAASLAHLFIGNKETLGFYCNGKTPDSVEAGFTLAPKRGYQQEKRILNFLAGADVNKGLEYTALFHEAYHLMGGSCLIFITPRITTEMVKRAGNLRKAGYHPVFLWLKSRSVLLPLGELESAGAPYFAVEKRRDGNAFFISRTR
jgi:uncharacterized protein (DUF58 family)